jgi:hypothetical protein
MGVQGLGRDEIPLLFIGLHQIAPDHPVLGIFLVEPPEEPLGRAHPTGGGQDLGPEDKEVLRVGVAGEPASEIGQGLPPLFCLPQKTGRPVKPLPVVRELPEKVQCPSIGDPIVSQSMLDLDGIKEPAAISFVFFP